MQGQEKVIDRLNQALSITVVNINQYFLHAKMLKNWGLIRLQESQYGFSIRQMKRADSLLERILFLEGKPNVHDIGYLRIGENTPEILASGLKQGYVSAKLVKQGITTAEGEQDFVSRQLLADILASVESEIDWHETQIALMTSMGLDNFLQSQTH